jgi:hypothetical protein
MTRERGHRAAASLFLNSACVHSTGRRAIRSLKNKDFLDENSAHSSTLKGLALRSCNRPQGLAVI